MGQGVDVSGKINIKVVVAKAILDERAYENASVTYIGPEAEMI